VATRLETLAPPSDRLTAWQWFRRNLFDGLWNSVVTVLTAALLSWIALAIFRWARTAHWNVITDNLRFWIVGLMPVELVPRALWAGGLITMMVVLTVAGRRLGVSVRVLAGAWGGILIAALWLMAPIRLDQVGGFYLTILLAVVAISASFPLGVVVGIGRVSQLPVVRYAAMAYIELIRGIPFIAVLLWFSIFVSLVSGDALTKVQRAMIAMTIFSSAYVAETMRAGIEGVPRGQVEAARAVGLSGARTMWHIVLPQAFRNMIPALVGQFISLFKDTSLTVIIGLSELVGTGRALLSITRYLHDVREVYVFLLVVFFICSYALSSASRRLEKRMGLGER